MVDFLEKLGLGGKKVKEVGPGDFFEVKEGQTVIFGRNPENSLSWQPTFRGVMLPVGRSLSRAVVSYTLDKSGKLTVKGLTHKNDVYVNEIIRGAWKRNQLFENETEQVLDHAIIDIYTLDDTLIRLNPAGGSQGKTRELKFRVDINPLERGLNK